MKTNAKAQERRPYALLSIIIQFERRGADNAHAFIIVLLRARSGADEE